MRSKMPCEGCAFVWNETAKGFVCVFWTPLVFMTCRRAHEWKRPLHLCCSWSWGQVPQCQQRFQPLQPQQHAVPLVSPALRHVWRDALRPQQAARGLPQQPVPQLTAEGDCWAHHGVLPGPAWIQVGFKTLCRRQFLRQLLLDLTWFGACVASWSKGKGGVKRH